MSARAAAAADQSNEFDGKFSTMIHGGWLLVARGRLRLAELRPALAVDRSVRVLEASGARLEHARAMADLGPAVREG